MPQHARRRQGTHQVLAVLISRLGAQKSVSRLWPCDPLRPSLAYPMPNKQASFTASARSPCSLSGGDLVSELAEEVRAGEQVLVWRASASSSAAPSRAGQSEAGNPIVRRLTNLTIVPHALRR